MKRITIALVMAVLFTIPAWADNFKFVSLEYPPLEFKGSNGEAQGIAVDIVTKIMTNLGHTIDIKIYPWARSLKMTKEGLADAIFTAYKNPERETFLDYSKNVLVSQIVSFYVLKDSDITYDGDFCNPVSESGLLPAEQNGAVEHLPLAKIPPEENLREGILAL